MSQKRAKVVTVIDSEGARGTIDTTSPTLNKRERQALVYTEDGQQVLVPVDELRKEEDGSFTLPFSLRAVAAGEPLPSRDPNPSAGRGAAPGREADGDGEVVVPVIEETLQLEKRRVEAGGVRVRKVVNEREELVDEPLMREEVQVRRVPVGRVVDGPVPVRHEGDTMIIPLLEEVLVVEKRLMLKEELHVTKGEVETHRPQRVRLRREEAVVERVGDEAGEDETVLAEPRPE